VIVIYAVLLLGVLIFVHELGHFLVAKTLGVKVLKFSLGFGPRIVGKTYGDTEYRISAIPLGGYVKMLGENPGEELQESEKEKAYNYQPVWKRFSIVFSGPFFNFVLAACIFVFIFLSGIPVPHPDIGKVRDGSAAEKAGFVTGDTVLEINGKKVHGWNDIDSAIAESSGKSLLFTIKREEETRELTVLPERRTVKNIFCEESEIWDVGISQLVYPEIGKVMKSTPADKAGLQKGDRIIEVEGVPLTVWQDMTEIIHESPEKPLHFKIKREDAFLSLTITPEKKTRTLRCEGDKDIGLIGIGPGRNDFIKKFSVVESISLGMKRTWDISVFTLVAIGKLIQRVIPADTIGGPILIFQMAGEQASQGPLDFFGFMAVISINLGILNLLPIPILDGGHLLFLTIEAVRRKPLSEQVIMMAQKIGLVILLTLMAFAFYNDIVRWITGKTIPW
jgi:regulator of sigma E protease